MASQRCTVTVSAQPAGSPGPIGPTGPAGPPGATGPAGTGGILSPYLTPPLVPAPFNDEFDSGSPALEARGWQTFNSVSGVAMTRLGDVTTQVPTLTGSQYNSTLVGGVLRVQATSGMMVLKPVTAPLQVAARLGDPLVSANHYVTLQLTTYNTALNATCERVTSGYAWGKHVYATMYENQFWYTERQAVPPAGISQQVFMLEVQHPGASWDWRNAVVDATSGRITWLDLAPVNMLSATPSYAGFEVLTAPARYSWVELDFIRQYPYGSWFPA